MPNRNKTGPEGKGPRTGRGLGLCGDNTARGRGKGLGAGLGLRRNADNESENVNKDN